MLEMLLNKLKIRVLRNMGFKATQYSLLNKSFFSYI